MHAVIVGGSVAGLACAVALRRVGVDVSVFERSLTIRQGGAGIGLNAESIGILQSWGLDTNALTLPMPIEEVRTCGGDPLHRDEAYNFRSAHWYDIYSNLLDLLPRGTVRLGSAVTGIEWIDEKKNSPGGPVAVTLDKGEIVRCDFVVACDGVASSMRGIILPDTVQSAPLRYCGYAAWRGVVEEGRVSSILRDGLKERYPELGNCLYFELSDHLPSGGHNVVYKVPGGKINWLWYLPRPSPATRGIAQMDMSSDDLNSLHKKAEEIWGASNPHFAQLVRSTSSPFLNYIFDRDPLHHYTSSNGLATLCGDAAHATSPHFLRSTNMSIVDAATLAECLRESLASHSHRDAVLVGLREYEKRRLSSTGQEVLFARFLGQLKQGYLEPKQFSTQTPTEDREALGQNHFPSKRWQKRVILAAL